MRIKVFVPNKDGKIELTKEELESLLNESYRQGWDDRPYYNGFYYSSPGISLTECATDTASTLNVNNNISSVTNTCTEALEKDLEAFKVALKDCEVKAL